MRGHSRCAGLARPRRFSGSEPSHVDFHTSTAQAQLRGELGQTRGTPACSSCMTARRPIGALERRFSVASAIYAPFARQALQLVTNHQTDVPACVRWMYLRYDGQPLNARTASMRPWDRGGAGKSLVQSVGSRRPVAEGPWAACHQAVHVLLIDYWKNAAAASARAARPAPDACAGDASAFACLRALIHSIEEFGVC